MRAKVTDRTLMFAMDVMNDMSQMTEEAAKKYTSVLKALVNDFFDVMDGEETQMGRILDDGT